jgi:hypothetical protein
MRFGELKGKWIRKKKGFEEWIWGSVNCAVNAQREMGLENLENQENRLVRPGRSIGILLKKYYSRDRTNHLKSVWFSWSHSTPKSESADEIQFWTVVSVILQRSSLNVQFAGETDFGSQFPNFHYHDWMCSSRFSSEDSHIRRQLDPRKWMLEWLIVSNMMTVERFFGLQRSVSWGKKSFPSVRKNNTDPFLRQFDHLYSPDDQTRFSGDQPNSVYEILFSVSK